MILRFLVIAGIVWLLLRMFRQPSAPEPQSRPRVRVANMVRCAHCGLHVPASESLQAGDRRYCCPEHLRADRTQGHERR